ncbi:NfeD family protein [Gorillibacterium massiliense]|uniref:NfeD family protein n=1 Tax=Gorillibacterium massiliense TaxID=1280390 RepID=UPI0004B5B8B5|nr:NfeD family protein [Gorillibacterium massiliense]
MLEVYTGCLVFGVLFAVVSVFLGDIISTSLDGILDFLSADYLNPTVLASGITLFGGVGILTTQYTDMSRGWVLTLAILAAAIGGLAVHFFYVVPMHKSENSTGYSMRGLTGRLGEVITPIPSNGYGEVLIRAGVGVSNHIAASFEHNEIQAGVKVVVVEVKDGILYVTRFENK